MTAAEMQMSPRDVAVTVATAADRTAERRSLLVLASTYPRWAGDPEPGFVHELCKRLADDFKVTVLAPHAAGALRTESMDGVRIHRFRYAPERLETLVNGGGIVANLKRSAWKWLLVPCFLAGQALAMWRLIRTLRPDAIHAHWLIPQGLLVALLGLVSRRSPPFLVTSHGADLFALRGRILTAVKRWVVRRAAAVTVVSEGMRTELARIGVDVAKVSVQSMGVDLRDRFTPDAGASRSPDEILFVGRFVEKKGLRQLIDAMPQIIAALPATRLTVVGFGPEESERRQQVNALGLAERVRFMGALAQVDLPPLYRRAALLAAPFVTATTGDEDGLGLVLVEALGCGCPVIAGDIAAVRDLPVTVSAADDPQALAAAVVAMLRTEPDARSRDAAKMRDEVLRRFDWRAVGTGYSHCLSAIIAGV